MFQKDYWKRKQLTERRRPEHPVVSAYVLPKINELRHYVNLTKQTRLLDVGCGNGFFTFYFDKMCDTYGVDYSKKMLQMNPVKKTFCMDAGNLAFADNSFNVVFCHGLLHHVKNVDNVIQEMRRVSKKHIIILEPNRNNPLMFLYVLGVREERLALKFSLAYLQDVVGKNGLKITASFSYGMFTPNKTPTSFLPLVSMFNCKHWLGTTNFIIAKKD